MRKVLFLAERLILFSSIKSCYQIRFVAYCMCFVCGLNQAQAQTPFLKVDVPNKYECYISGTNIDLLVHIEGIEPFSTKEKKRFQRKQLMGKMVRLEYQESNYKAKKAMLEKALENSLKQRMSAEAAMEITTQ